MAEIGLVSAIIALAGAGAKLGIQLYAIADSVGSAGREARMIAAEVSVFSQSLTALSKTLERRTSEGERLQEIAQSLLNGCQAVLLQLSELTAELAPVSYSKFQHGAVMSLVARVKWLLQKPKVEFIRRSIDSFRSTLILLVTSMDLTEALDRKAPEEIKDSLRSQVETLVQTAKDANASLVQIQKFAPEADLQPQSTGGKPSIESGSDAGEQLDVQSEVLLIDFGNNDDTTTESKLPSEALGPTNSSTGLQSLDLAVTRTSIVHTQQLVLSLASDALDRRQVRSNWSWQQNGDPATRRRNSAEVDSEGQDSFFSSPPYQLSESRPEKGKISAETPYVEDASDDEMHGPASMTPSVDSYTVQPPSPKSNKPKSDAGTAPTANRIDNLENLLQSILGPTSADYLRSARSGGIETDQERIKRLEESIHNFMNAKTQFGQGGTPYGQENYGQRGDGQNSYGQTSYGQMPYPQTPYGHTPYDQASYGRNPFSPSPYSPAYDAMPHSNKEPMEKKNDEIDALKQLIQKQEEARLAREAELAKQAETEAARKAREAHEMFKEKEAEERVMAVKVAADRAAKEAAEKTKKLEEEIARLKPDPDSVKAPVKFKDAVGRKFSFPFYLCKTWKGMEALVKQAFLHVDVIGDHVHQGHYDLTGPDGEIILPQVWDTMIQPDWEISMHMWPMPEPEVQTDKVTRDAAALSDPFAGLGLEELGLIGGRTKEPKPGHKKKKRPKVQPNADVPIFSDFSTLDIPPPPSKKDVERQSLQSLDTKTSVNSKRRWYRPSSWSRNSSTIKPDGNLDGGDMKRVE